MPTIFSPHWVGAGLGSVYGTSATTTSSDSSTQWVYCNASTGTSSAAITCSEQYIQSGNYAWYDYGPEYQEYQLEQALGAEYQNAANPGDFEQRLDAVARRAGEITGIIANFGNARVEPAVQTEAQQKAEKVLVTFLSPEQRETYKRHRWFDVVTPLGRYRLEYGWAGNIGFFGRGDKELSRYCIHPREGAEFRVPEAENLLSQKLMLEFEELEFLKIANRHAPRLAA